MESMCLVGESTGSVSLVSCSEGVSAYFSLHFAEGLRVQKVFTWNSAGYTWNTNQFGLAMDLIVEYELIKPNGHIIRVDEYTDPELFFALKVCNPSRTVWEFLRRSIGRIQ